jgi:uncharacterized protein (UPF0332 family)
LIVEDADYIGFRVSEAREAFADAVTLIDRGSTLSVVDRLYYACFYAVSALICTEGERPIEDLRLLTAFSRDWIKTGRFPARNGKLFRYLFSLRNGIDFGDEAPPTREAAQQLIPEGQKFVDEVLGYVERHFYVSRPIVQDVSRE